MSDKSYYLIRIVLMQKKETRADRQVIMRNFLLLNLMLFLTSCSSGDSEEIIIVIPKLLTSTTSTFNGENNVGYEFVYDEANKLIKQKRTNVLNNENEYVYNDENVVRVNRSYDANAIVSIAYTLLYYDGNNNIKRLTQYDTDDNVRYDFLYTYNSENILLTRNIIGLFNNTNRFYDYQYNSTENSLKRTQRNGIRCI